MASMVLLALCLLVLLSNYLDRLHTTNVKNSISTMYEDRLIVEDYILKMTTNVYQIRELLNEVKQFSGQGKYVFPSFRVKDKSMSDNTLISDLRRMGYTKDEFSTS